MDVILKKDGCCIECNYGLGGKTPSWNDYQKAFQEKILNDKKINGKGDVLVLESLGSITDCNEVDHNLFIEIFKFAINNCDFKTILIETHVNFINDDLVSEICKIKKESGKKTNVGFEVGVESMFSDERLLIMKPPAKNSDLEKKYKLLTESGLLLSINLIYGFPFMDESQRVESMIRSIKEIASTMPEAGIVLFLMSIKENTILKILADLGLYNLPNPLGLVEIINRILKDENLEDTVITLSWFGLQFDDDIFQELCYDNYVDSDLENSFVKFFSGINATFELSQRKKQLKDFKLLLEEKGVSLIEFEKQLEEQSKININFLRKFMNTFTAICNGCSFPMNGKTYRIERKKRENKNGEGFNHYLCLVEQKERAPEEECR